MIHAMGYYTKIGRRSHGSCSSSSRGFRLNSKRFSVQRLRARFFCLFKLLSRWKSSYGQAVQSLKRNMSRSSHGIKRNSSTNSRRSLVVEVSGDCRMRTFRRSNSFYSEAIADCLEFIKRSSLSMEQKQVCPR